MNQSTQSPLFYLSDAELPLVDRADGCRMWDTDGREYIDACSGAISVNLGHNHPAVKAAIAAQMERVCFSYRTQFESQAAVDLANKLVSLTDGRLDKVYFVGSGSESVESAMKLALQYFYVRGEHSRHRFVSLRPSYHGSTLGALSVTAYQPLEQPFAAFTPESVHIPAPCYYRRTEADDAAHDSALLAAAEAAIAAFGEQRIAAVVIEPVGGASTGARELSPGYLKGLRALCDRTGALLIMDEVLTGVGRTGDWFAWQHSGVAPDIMTLAKGLGAGYYPVGAMLARHEITQPVMASGGFMHGHTYAGNPLACATALAVIQAIESEGIIDRVRSQGAALKQSLQALADEFSFVGDVRGRGLLLALEFVQDKATKEPFPASENVYALITRLAKAEGLLVYPRRCLDGVAGDHVLITPPLILDDETRREIVQKLKSTLNKAREILEEKSR